MLQGYLDFRDCLPMLRLRSGGSRLLNTLGFGLEVVRSGYREGGFFFVLCTSILNMLICYTLLL